jgi:hypothetical protein
MNNCGASFPNNFQQLFGSLEDAMAFVLIVQDTKHFVQIRQLNFGNGKISIFIAHFFTLSIPKKIKFLE